MSRLDERLARPEFESVTLDVAVAEAHRLVTDAMCGLNTSETDVGKKYRTTDGMLVAIVGPGDRASDEETASLVYRTVPAAELATRKAAKIREALDPYAIDG